MLADALTLQLGYNATLVAVGATLLGVAAGVTGSFLFLRKRALVSDAIGHATLPGVALAFIVMVALGGDGRSLAGLLAGAALSAWAGLLCMQWLTRHTRLAEDAAIGAVLSVYFGAGIVLLTVIQTMTAGRQAGLESFLLGSTAGMLFSDAVLIAAGGLAALILVLVLRRPMLAVSFDAEFAAATGTDTRRIDLAMMGLVMAVTVIGLKVVGLVLIVALLVIPPVAARFWSDRADQVVAGAGVIGGLSGYLGAALSASAPQMPTGPIIVLVAFGFFTVSFLFAPARGVIASALRIARHRRRVRLQEGLLALAKGRPVANRAAAASLRREGLMRGDGTATDAGRARAARALRDDRRWRMLRTMPLENEAAMLSDGLASIETVLTEDQLRDIDAALDRTQGARP